MPTSRPEIIPAVVNTVMKLSPKSILELGIGFGKYGYLFREYLEVWPSSDNPSRVNEKNWEIIIDGIEIHSLYLSEFHHTIYDKIIIGDCRVEIDSAGQYDLIFMGDMIEHMPKEDGFKLLDKCLKHAKNILVTTPNYFNKQGSEFGNEHERHHCSWTVTDFAKYNAKVDVINGKYIVALI